MSGHEHHPGSYGKHLRRVSGYLRHPFRGCNSPDSCVPGAECPISNLIPDWSEPVSRGDWRGALQRLHAVCNFPEFTGYTSPASCEDIRVLSIKALERAIVDRGWAQGWIRPELPARRSGYRVAIVGSGPTGLAAAQQLNRAGHKVTVFEREDTIGGMMAYGIPNFRFARYRLARRVRHLAREGVIFRSGVEVGRTLPLEAVIGEFDAVGLCIGAHQTREAALPGRTLGGIYMAMDYLKHANRVRARVRTEAGADAGGKRVIVLGGGALAQDCVAVARRQGAAEVVQIADERPPGSGGIPIARQWKPYAASRSQAQGEGERDGFLLHACAFVDTEGDGWVHALRAARVGQGAGQADILIPAETVILAAGFAGAETQALEAFGIAGSAGGCIRTDARLATNLAGVFAAGDARLGASLVVCAIDEGRDMARQIDLYLMGESSLPASQASQFQPLGSLEDPA